VAGYCIFTTSRPRCSGHGVVGGFCLTKDMANGNQLGPYLVTPDEVVTLQPQGDGRGEWSGEIRGIDIRDQP